MVLRTLVDRQMTDKRCRYSTSLFHRTITVISSLFSFPIFIRPHYLRHRFSISLVSRPVIFTQIEHIGKKKSSEACYSLFLSMNDKSNSNNINSSIEDGEET